MNLEREFNEEYGHMRHALLRKQCGLKEAQWWLRERFKKLEGDLLKEMETNLERNWGCPQKRMEKEDGTED
jgi:hypothetical protein